MRWPLTPTDESDRGDRRPVGLVVRSHLSDHPHRPPTQFDGVRGKGVTCLDPPQEVEPISNPERFNFGC
jgi:hypothetical protein